MPTDSQRGAGTMPAVPRSDCQVAACRGLAFALGSSVVPGHLHPSQLSPPARIRGTCSVRLAPCELSALSHRLPVRAAPYAGALPCMQVMRCAGLQPLGAARASLFGPRSRHCLTPGWGSARVLEHRHERGAPSIGSVDGADPEWSFEDRLCRQPCARSGSPGRSALARVRRSSPCARIALRDQGRLAQVELVRYAPTSHALQALAAFARGTAARLGVRDRKRYFRACIPAEVEATWPGS